MRQICIRVFKPFKAVFLSKLILHVLTVDMRKENIYSALTLPNINCSPGRGAGETSFLSNEAVRVVCAAVVRGESVHIFRKFSSKQR